jgi:hypothetical protein
MQHNLRYLDEPPVWLQGVGLSLGGFLVTIFANTTPIANLPYLRLITTLIGGSLSASALALKDKSKLSEEMALMSHEAKLDIHNAILQQTVKQFDPDEVLNPAPAITLPQGTDEASTLAATIIRTLATANPKRPLILNHAGNETGCSAVRMSFRPLEINHGLEAVKQSDLIHAACGLAKENKPAVYMDRGNVVVEIPRTDRQYMGFELTPSANTDAPKILVGYDSMTRQPIWHVLSPKGSSPSLLFCGTSGSGKSVWANAAILSLIYNYSPAQVRFAIIDCKGGNYTWMEGSPWLWGPICEDHNSGKRFLDQAIAEGERRQKVLFKAAGCRDIEGYNKSAKPEDRLPVLVFFVDEVAEWMSGLKGDPKAEARPSEVQGSLARIAQALRSAGVVLIVGTQKPVVEDTSSKIPVIGTLLKGNLPYRLALKVLTSKESEVGLGSSYNPDASQLLGRGDFLWLTPDGKLTRGQSAFVPDDDNSELERLHAIAANFHGVKVPEREPVEVVERYLETLEKSWDLPPVTPKVDKSDELLWHSIKALKMHPTKPSKTDIIGYIWGCSKGGSNFNKANPNSPLSLYERLLETNRESFVLELIKLGAKAEDIAWAAYDAKGDKEEALDAIRAISERHYFGWPYVRSEPDYPDVYEARYSTNWNATSKAVRQSNCAVCGERSAQAHHAYYRSWWGKVADNEESVIGIALFPLCDKHHKPNNFETFKFKGCAHHPSNWTQRGVWDSSNSLEFYLELLKGWVGK